MTLTSLDAIVALTDAAATTLDLTAVNAAAITTTMAGASQISINGAQSELFPGRVQMVQSQCFSGPTP